MTGSIPNPTPIWLRPAARPAAALYRCAIAWRNSRYDGQSPRRLPIPVICVGNLSAGGTGKTPVVSFLAERLLEAGRNPIIALRGYKSRRSSDSDEATEHRQRNSRACVVVGPDRFATISEHLTQHPDHDVVILDDGFQHRSLFREFDLVLVDATRPPDRDALLPLGYLREPADNLGRADAVIITRCELVENAALVALESRIQNEYGVTTTARLATKWVGVTDSKMPGRTMPVEILAKRRCFLICGIGNPGAFVSNAESHGAHIVEERFLPDHVRYTERMIRQITDQANRINADVLTTQKDWVKIGHLINTLETSTRFMIPQIAIKPVAGLDAIWEAMSTIIDRQQE